MKHKENIRFTKKVPKTGQLNQPEEDVPKEL